MSDVKSIKVEEFSLVDFVMKIQQGIRDGYEVTDQSEEAPLQIGGGFYTIMREKAEVDVELRLKAWCDKVQVRVDTEKLQEQLKAGGEIEQMLVDSLVVEEKADKSEELHEKLIGTIPITIGHIETIEPPKEPTLDESLPKEEQAVLQTKQTTKRGRK